MSDLNQHCHEIFSYINEIRNQGHAISSALAILDIVPASIYIKDLNGVYLARNYFAAQMMNRLGFEDGIDKEAVVGKTDYDFVHKDIADTFRANDQEIISTNPQEPQIYCEDVVLSPHQTSKQFSTKMPFHDGKGRLIGILGSTVSQIVDTSSHSDSYEHARQLLISALNSNSIASINNIPDHISQCLFHRQKSNHVLLKLSQRELKCLYLISKGNTHKQLAYILDISVRTVETYLNNAKLKLSCKHKSGLTKLFWEYIDEELS